MSINTMKEFQKQAGVYMEQGRTFGAGFRQFVRDAVTFYWEKGNQNVQVGNTLVQIAYESAGMNGGQLVDYLSNATGHIIVKDKVQKRRYRLGKKDSKRALSITDGLLFIEVNPDWTTYGVGANSVPASFKVDIRVAKLFSDAEKAGQVDQLKAELTKALVA